MQAAPGVVQTRELEILVAPVTVPAVQPSTDPWWRRWYFVVAVGALVFYACFGLWMLYGADYAIGDAIARASSSRSIAHSRDQHLMGVGFYWAPGPVFVQVPFMALFSRLGVAEWAMVFPTAVATAATIPLLGRLGEFLGVPARWAKALIGLFAFNPYTVFFAGSGMSEPWFVLCFVGAVAAYLRWAHDRRTRDLAALGLWLGFAQMMRHENLAVVAVLAAVVAWQSPKGRRVQAGLATALPAVFYLFVWTAVSIAIIRKPWWKVISEAGSGQGRLTNETLQGDNSFARVFGYTVDLSVRMAPVLIAAVVFAGVLGELAGQLRRRADERRVLLVLPIALCGGIFPAVTFRLLLSQQSFGDPRYYTPLIATAALVALVALRSHVTLAAKPRIPIPIRAGMLIALAAIGCVSAFATLGNARLSSVTGEAAVVRRLFNLNEDGVAGRGRTDQWRAFAAALDAVVEPNDRIVLDSATAHPVFLFTNHPKQTTTDRDKDAEALLAGTNPAFTIAVVTPAGRTAMALAIREMTRAAPAGKQWVKVPSPDVGWNFGNPEIWRLVPRDPNTPAAPAPRSSVPPTQRTPTNSQPQTTPNSPPASTATSDEQREDSER